MELVFSRYSSIKITEAVAEAVAQYGTRLGMLQLFDYDGTLQISEAMVKSALSNRYHGFEVLSLLLDRGGSSHVTDKICELAAASDDQQIWKMLVERCNLDSEPDCQVPKNLPTVPGCGRKSKRLSGGTDSGGGESGCQ